ncbi:toll/interleukin-1 receptor domain-containing protein [Bradyrhizobium sp. 199]|uniref:toll/interleukin-1 receptor domain-containing protein n=1 Tax=Bradyrhizobium sp. 199 TaxID=2782664 RepID=UPI001FFB4F8C|nr:toll/interleukin-1 receptor domain-containing protein [Bradyrhizobium sp. 199]MCK1362285.1 toll/interleukin-1 receptor domain-containing protein [Bradyrhizobium sp. 199]
MNGFISYSHVDYQLMEQFRTHARAIERAFSFQLWADRRIAAGYYWDEQIARAIACSDVFVLLISPGFIASDYIFDREIPAINSRRATGALVLPVVLRRCMWQIIASALQAVPVAEGHVRPIMDWRPNDHGFDSARDQITSAISSYFGLTAHHINWGQK